MIFMQKVDDQAWSRKWGKKGIVVCLTRLCEGLRRQNSHEWGIQPESDKHQSWIAAAFVCFMHRSRFEVLFMKQPKGLGYLNLINKPIFVTIN